jgi:hypothetical protein
MWHTTQFVAQSRLLNPEMLTEFAVKNSSKYGIVENNGRVEVGTWHVDNLCKDFKTLHPEGITPREDQAAQYGSFSLG